MVDWLARHPDERDAARRRPVAAAGRHRGADARADAGVAGGRYATADFEIGGVQIKAGDDLTVCGPPPTSTPTAFADPLDGRLRAHRQPPHRVRQRVPPLPRLAPRAHGAPGGRWRRCTAHPRLRLDPDHPPGYKTRPIRPSTRCRSCSRRRRSWPDARAPAAGYVSASRAAPRPARRRRTRSGRNPAFTSPATSSRRATARRRTARPRCRGRHGRSARAAGTACDVVGERVRGRQAARRARRRG